VPDLSRRELLVFTGGLALGCGSEPRDDPGGDGTCPRIPEETPGPFPGDGTNGQNLLTQPGVVRGDIRGSFGGPSGVADGVVTTVTLTIVSAASCAPLAGAAVYLWQCDRAGDYSMYSPAIADENYLRGVQIAGADGKVAFTTIFPGCYPGRWPHLHFEVFRSMAAATTGANAVATSQLAFPEDACVAAYAAPGYEAAAARLAELDLEDDFVFQGGLALQLARVTGSIDDGFVAELDVAVRS
jgi:protocatechuate 3,4-dioxygenase beta subunit